MSWKNVLLKDTRTATRSADLWVMNDEANYFPIIQLIKQKVKGYLDWGWSRKEVIDDILRVARNDVSK